jgi:hypothetical protein
VTAVFTHSYHIYPNAPPHPSRTEKLDLFTQAGLLDSTISMTFDPKLAVPLKVCFPLLNGGTNDKQHIFLP